MSADDESLRKGYITLFKYIIGEETAFTIDDNLLTAWEGDTAIFSFRRTDTILTPISFYFEVNDTLTTATVGEDYYITTSNPLTFWFEDNRIKPSKQLKVVALRDGETEGMEKVVIDIKEVSPGAYLENDTRLEVRIFNR